MAGIIVETVVLLKHEVRVLIKIEQFVLQQRQVHFEEWYDEWSEWEVRYLLESGVEIFDCNGLIEIKDNKRNKLTII